MNKDEKKAIELASRLVGKDQNQKPLINILLEMAAWKESELKNSIKLISRKLELLNKIAYEYRHIKPNTKK